MTDPLIPIATASKWVRTLALKYRSFRNSRREEIQAIADVFGDPEHLAQTYIEPHCQHHNPADVDEDMPIRISKPIWSVLDGFLNGKSFAERDGSNQLFILADAGMGKTSLLIMMALTHLNGFWPSGIQLRILKLGPDSNTQMASIRGKGNTILLLDALDEDPDAWDDIENRLTSILEGSRHFRRVIITCRTQFFPPVDKDPFERRGRIVVSYFTCPMIYLSPFSDEQVETYLAKRFPRKSQARLIAAARRIVLQMDSLRFRPMLLSRIEDLLDSEVDEPDEFFVYEALLETWLTRECRKLQEMKRGTRVSKPKLWIACIAIALYMARTGKQYLSKEELKKLVSTHPEAQNVNYMDVGGRSFLNRNSKGDFRFAHYSVQEFLVVRAVSERELNIELPTPLRLSQLQAIFLLRYIARVPRTERRKLSTKTLSLDGIHFLSADLASVDLSDSSLRESAFSEATLRGAKLRGVDFTSARFDNSKLMLTKGSAMRFDETSFRSSDLQGSEFSECSFRRTTWLNVSAAGALLRGANFDGAVLQDSDLSRATLVGSSFVGAKISNIIFTAAVLRGAKFVDSRIAQVVFDEADLEAADFSGSRLTAISARGANASRCQMPSVQFGNANFAKAVLKQAVCVGADFESADLTRANLENADLRGARLIKAKLRGANLKGAVLSGTDFTQAHLNGADIQGAELAGALVRDVDFSDVRFSDAQRPILKSGGAKLK